jgi:sugar phosphate isomerase/epimerase
VKPTIAPDEGRKLKAEPLMTARYAMPSRRDFLTTVAAGVGAMTVGPARAAVLQNEIKTALNGPLGLQLWSLRDYLPKDLPGTLAKVRGLGFREVEGAGLWGHTAADLRSALDAANLHCRSTHMGFERLRDDLPGALEEAKALGATWVVCPWIPHGSAFTRDDALKSAEAFNRIGGDAQTAGLRFAYHCHGYEFTPSSEGTLFDTLAGATDAARVMFQVDVFHAFHGGADPARLIKRYAGRVPSLHLKDLKKGAPVKVGQAIAQADVDVPLGAGQLDLPSILRAAMKAGTSMYYIEDESPDPFAHIPKSVAFVQSFK